MRLSRYLLELLAALVAYAITLMASLRFLPDIDRESGLRIAVSVAPMVPALAACWVIMRHLRRLDELQRTIQLEALGLAFAGTAIVTFSYGFLENAGLPKLTMFSVWPLMAALWVAGVLLGRWRYR